MAIYNRRTEFTKQELANLNTKRESLWSYLYGIIRFIGIVTQNLYCVCSYLILTRIIFLPLSWFRIDLFARLENFLYNSLLFIVSSWSMGAGIFVFETGDEYKQLIEDDPPNEINSSDSNATSGQLMNKKSGDTQSTKGYVSKTRNTNNSSLVSPLSSKIEQRKPRILILCNHISTADVPLMMQSFSTLTNHSVLWVLDAQFKFTNFGIVCSSHGDFFVAKNCFVDGTLRDQVLRHPERNLLVLFPEGGFLRKRIDGSNRYASRNNLPKTTYVTHPRFGAFKDLMDPSVGVTHIVDVTLMYNDIRNPLSILNIAFGVGRQPVILNHRVYERSQIETTEEWLRKIWLDKDKQLEKYYKDRANVYKMFEGTMRVARLDWFKVLAVHLFYLLVCYLTMYRLFSATNILMLTAKDLYYSNI